MAKTWGEMIAEEFYKQGDKERQLGMKPLAFCDRSLAGPTTAAQNQMNFIDFVCKPTVEALATVLPEVADNMLHHLVVNRAKYKHMVDGTAEGSGKSEER